MAKDDGLIKQTLEKNVQWTINKKKKTIDIHCKLDVDFGPSVTGRTNIVATTGGPKNCGIPGLSVGLTIFRKEVTKPQKVVD